VLISELRVDQNIGASTEKANKKKRAMFHGLLQAANKLSFSS
jgi:hypothetical protein